MVKRDYAISPRGNKAGMLKRGVNLDEIFGNLPRYIIEDKRVEKKVIDNREAFIYFMIATNGLVKIGKTINYEKRIAELKNESPIELKLLDFIQVDRVDAYKIEAYFHRLFAKKRAHGEWFKLSENDMQLVESWKTIRNNRENKGRKTRGIKI